MVRPAVVGAAQAGIVVAAAETAAFAAGLAVAVQALPQPAVLQAPEPPECQGASVSSFRLRGSYPS